jgi:hypothetical protein
MRVADSRQVGRYLPGLSALALASTSMSVFFGRLTISLPQHAETTLQPISSRVHRQVSFNLGRPRSGYCPPSCRRPSHTECEVVHLEVLRWFATEEGEVEDTMQIETRTATFHVGDIQAAYNDAVLSGRTLLAREIEQLWLGAIADQNPGTEKRGEEQRKSVLSVETQALPFHRKSPTFPQGQI